MPAIRLTQAAVERLPPPRDKPRIVYWDNHLPGFGLRITEKDARSWVAMYRVSGKLVMETLGPVARIPKVDEARQLARAAIQRAVSGGVHPTEAKKRRRHEAEKAAASIFKAAAEQYVERFAKKNTRETTWREVERQLRVDVFPYWENRPIKSITRDDVAQLLQRIEDRGSPVQANRQRARLHTLFGWAVRQDLIESNPVSKVDKVIKEKGRDRVLTDDEIVAFWTACDRLGWPFGALYKLLLVTAQRRSEVAGMTWDELDLEKRVWTIPRERAKNDRAHTVHLSDLAVEIIDSLPRQKSRLVFTTNGERHVSGYSRSKAGLDRAMGKDDWILHDLRRTAATGMARLNIPPHVVDKILNHTSGTIRGVAAVYNRFEYIEERKAALLAWSSYIEALIGRSSQNVVRFGGSKV
jgi:integrase